MRIKSLVILVAVVVTVIAGVFGASAVWGSGEKCSAHLVIISDNAMHPQRTTASLCDTLTIRNDDRVVREIGFGPHDQHIAYDGVRERILDKGEGFTVTMNARGLFYFHDHYHEEVIGNFTVK